MTPEDNANTAPNFNPQPQHPAPSQLHPSDSQSQPITGMDQPPAYPPLPPITPPAPPSPAYYQQPPYVGPDAIPSGHPVMYPPTGYPQTGNPPTGYPQTGNPPTGYPQTGNPPTGYPQTGNPPTGYPQTGNPPTGYPQTGNPPVMYPQSGYYQPPMYPLYNSPPPAPKRFQTWQLVSLWVAAGLIVCCLFGVFASTANRSSPSSTSYRETHIDTATPMPTMTATPFGSGNTVELGTNYTSTTSSFTIIGARTLFTSSDQLAYVVTLTQGIGAFSMNRMLVRVGDGGSQSVVDTKVIAISDPESNLFAGIMQIGAIMQYNYQSYGKYRLQFTDGKHILAATTFTYIG